MRHTSSGQRRIYPARIIPMRPNPSYLQPQPQSNVMGYWPEDYDVTASGGTVTVTGPGVYAIDTEGAAASDTVHTILGGVNRMEVILRAKSAVRTVKIAPGVGNICGGTHFQMTTTNHRMRLICDASLDYVETARMPVT